MALAAFAERRESAFVGHGLIGFWRCARSSRTALLGMTDCFSRIRLCRIFVAGIASLAGIVEEHGVGFGFACFNGNLGTIRGVYETEDLALFEMRQLPVSATADGL